MITIILITLTILLTCWLYQRNIDTPITRHSLATILLILVINIVPNGIYLVDTLFGLLLLPLMWAFLRIGLTWAIENKAAIENKTAIQLRKYIRLTVRHANFRIGNIFVTIAIVN